MSDFDFLSVQNSFKIGSFRRSGVGRENTLRIALERHQYLEHHQFLTGVNLTSLVHDRSPIFGSRGSFWTSFQIGNGPEFFLGGLWISNYSVNTVFAQLIEYFVEIEFTILIKLVLKLDFLVLEKISL